MEIIRHPDTEHVQQLHTWLEEEAETGEGFLCNWNVIASTHDEGRLYVVVQNGEAVALLSWWQYSTAAGINILTVKPSLRCSGIGKLLVDAFIGDMIEQQISIVKLQAVPMISQGFWSNMGFVEDPDNPSEKSMTPQLIRIWSSCYMKHPNNTSNLTGLSVVYFCRRPLRWQKKPTPRPPFNVA